MQISKHQTLHPLSIAHKMQIQSYLHYHNYTKAVKLETIIFNKNCHQIQKNQKNWDTSIKLIQNRICIQIL